MTDNAVPVYYLALGVGPMPGVGSRWVWVRHYRHGPGRTQQFRSVGDIPMRVLCDLTQEQIDVLRRYFADDPL